MKTEPHYFVPLIPTSMLTMNIKWQVMRVTLRFYRKIYKEKEDLLFINAFQCSCVVKGLIILDFHYDPGEAVRPLLSDVDPRR